MRRGKIRLVYETRFQRDFGKISRFQWDFGKISRFQRVSGFHGEFRGIPGEVYEISRSGGPLELVEYHQCACVIFLRYKRAHCCAERGIRCLLGPPSFVSCYR